MTTIFFAKTADLPVIEGDKLLTRKFTVGRRQLIGHIDVADLDGTQHFAMDFDAPDSLTLLVHPNLIDDRTVEIACYPVPTGIGSKSRVMSDEDWVGMAAEEIANLGIQKFLAEFLGLLRLSAPLWADGPHPEKVGDYPPSRFSLRMPLPNATFLEAGGQIGGKRSDEKAGAILSNPVYSGIGPYTPLIADGQWEEAATKQVKEFGAPQFLANMLYCLKKAFGSPGQRRELPYAYQVKRK